MAAVSLTRIPVPTIRSTDNSVVQASRFTGAAWSAPSDISGSGEAVQGPQVKVDSSGVVTALWRRQSDGVNYVVQASRSSASAWSPPVDLSLTGVSASNQQHTVSSAGVVTAIWDRGLAIQASRLVPPVVAATPVPTLSEWAMILFGTLLAGGAALYIQRRRVAA